MIFFLFNNDIQYVFRSKYARIISNGELDVNSFTVHLEKWNAGNMYVGKYSDLSTLEETYLLSLQGWLQYLNTKTSEYADYYDNSLNEKELLAEIEKIR